MIIEKTEKKIIEHTEIVLIDDVWAKCKAMGWDKGNVWNNQIAPHKPDTLVRVVIQILPEYKYVSVEAITDKLLEEALGGKKNENK